jgi:hypothetical protein
MGESFDNITKKIYIFSCVIIIILYFYYTFYYINLFRKLNYVYVFSNSTPEECGKNNNILEKYTSRNIQFNNLYFQFKNFKLTETVFIVFAILISYVFLYNTCKNRFTEYNKLLLLLIIPIIIPFVYIYAVINKKIFNVIEDKTFYNKKEKDNSPNVFKNIEDYIAKLQGVIYILKYRNLFDINIHSGNNIIELFKYNLLKNILYDENLESYNDAKLKYTDSYEIIKVYINDNPIKDDQKIYFMPNGLQTPISFLLSDGNYEMWVDGDINGNFILSN